MRLDTNHHFMSNTAQSLADRFREVMLNGKCVANTNFKDKLSTVSFDQAFYTMGQHNSIALLTYHMDYYVKGVLDVYNGQPLTIRDKYSFDMPRLESPEAWEALKKDLNDHSEAYAAKVEQMTDETLRSVFVHSKYGSNQRNIEAMIEHGYYHLGQISLIHKLI